MKMSRNSGSSLRPDQGPWRTTACDAYYFLLDARHDALQQVVDAGLNSAAGSQRFVVTVDAVAMTFQSFNNMHIVPAGERSPRLNYLEAAFFVMVSDTQNDGQVFVWSPFMYCADSMATISGREVFGFPKEYSTISLDSRRFSVQASGFTTSAARNFAPTLLSIISGGVRDPLIEQAHLLAVVDLAKIRLEKHDESLTGFWGMLGGLGSPLGKWVELLINPAVNFVFDRSQFEPGAGRWQSQLLHAYSPVNQFSFERFVIPLAFKIADTFSHPVVSQLGLVTSTDGSGTVGPLFGCKLLLDFSLNSPQPL
jgi:hypothetical protein